MLCCIAAVAYIYYTQHKTYSNNSACRRRALFSSGFGPLSSGACALCVPRRRRDDTHHRWSVGAARSRARSIALGRSSRDSRDCGDGQVRGRRFIERQAVTPTTTRARKNERRNEQTRIYTLCYSVNCCCCSCACDSRSSTQCRACILVCQRKALSHTATAQHHREHLECILLYNHSKVRVRVCRRQLVGSAIRSHTRQPEDVSNMYNVCWVQCAVTRTSVMCICSVCWLSFVMSGKIMCVRSSST